MRYCREMCGIAAICAVWAIYPQYLIQHTQHSITGYACWAIYPRHPIRHIFVVAATTSSSAYTVPHSDDVAGSLYVPRRQSHRRPDQTLQSCSRTTDNTKRQRRTDRGDMVGVGKCTRRNRLCVNMMTYVNVWTARAHQAASLSDGSATERPVVWVAPTHGRPYSSYSIAPIYYIIGTGRLVHCVLGKDTFIRKYVWQLIYLFK